MTDIWERREVCDDARGTAVYCTNEWGKVRDLRGTLNPAGIVAMAQEAVARLSSLPPPGETAAALAAAPAPNATPRVPTRPKDLARWQATWRAVKWEYCKKSYLEVLRWLTKTHEGLTCSEKTLSDICEAGAAGLLD